MAYNQFLTRLQPPGILSWRAFCVCDCATVQPTTKGSLLLHEIVQRKREASGRATAHSLEGDTISSSMPVAHCLTEFYVTEHNGGSMSFTVEILALKKDLSYFYGRC